MSVGQCIALLKAEVERKLAPTPIIFSACPRFESSDLPLVFPPVDTVCCRSCRLANAQLILEPSLNNALSQIGQDFRGNSNGFQSRWIP